MKMTETEKDAVHEVAENAIRECMLVQGQLEIAIKCPLCFTRDKDCAYIPCGHRTCRGCAWRLGNGKADNGRCPFCKVPIKQILKTYG